MIEMIELGLIRRFISWTIMYTPAHFEVTERKEALAFIKAHAFGQLISMVEDRLFSSHLPFLLNDNEDKLLCHVAKQNPQWLAIEQQEVLLTFQGEHDYVSPTWLESAGVPTWNYQAVHVYGSAKTVTEPVALKAMVDALTNEHESVMKTPWTPEYKASLLNAIVGIEISIDDIQCKYKLSQNKSERDQVLVADALEERGSTQLSKAMKLNDK